MPADIRSFFGGKPASTPAEKPKPADDKKKRGRARKVIDDDEDDEVEVVSSKKSTPKKKKQPKTEPDLEETSAGDFFGKTNKPKRSEVVRPKSSAKTSAVSTPKKVNGSTKSTPNGRGSTRAAKPKNLIELDDNDFAEIMDLEEDNADDNFKADAKVGKRMGDDYEEGTEDDDVPVKPTRTNGKQKKIKNEDDGFAEDVDMKDTHGEDDFVVPDEDEKVTKSKSKGGRKRKSTAMDDDDDEPEPPKKRAASTKKPKEQPQDSKEVKDIFESIETIEPPPPPKADPDAEKPKFQYGQHANSAMPAGAIDISDLPHGEDNCLAGLTFVFTGQLQTLGREQGQNLVKQYGGKVTTAPSSKTSYVVLGEDAGPKKLETIAKYGLKVIKEQGLFQLIQRLPANGGDSVAAGKQAEKKAKEEEDIRQAAEEIDNQEKARLAAAKSKANANASAGSQSSTSQGKAKAAADGPDSRLWTVRYAPQALTQICGNKGQVEKLQNWLRNFPKNQKKQFKMGGADGSGLYRAVMIHGPPGVGKTTAAHLVAKLEGYDIVESNASDTRSKKLVETGLKGVLSTTSLMGYFSAGTDQIEASKKKLVLIMDEVDGMSAGDRGGVGALAAVAKKTQIPMILICNERKQPKMKPFDFVTYDLPFRRPTTDQIRSRISTIAYREGLKIPASVMNALIEGSSADIRQVVNMLSTAKLDSETMDFSSSKDMSKAWEKHIVLKPWDMVNKILGPTIWNAAAKSSLNDKQELYFNDHEMASLMLQENYLGTKPQRSNKYDSAAPKLRALASLDLISKAADSISDGDLVDRMIHGSQQQWSLMPTHAMFSFVRPASFVNGSLAGNQTRFTSWLGKNSNQGKLVRFIKEIQGHMRLRVSADRHELRQVYLPMLFQKLIKRLEKEGPEVVPEVIELMDHYYLTKDDWDAILELGVGFADQEKIKIETQTKSTFTRKYNQVSHPMPFMKASQVVAPKKAPAKERPDLEEAFDDSDDGAVDDAEVKDDEEETDLSKDKYVKVPKKRKAAAAKGGASKKRKSGDGTDSDAPKPTTKGKGKGKGKK